MTMNKVYYVLLYKNDEFIPRLKTD